MQFGLLKIYKAVSHGKIISFTVNLALGVQLASKDGMSWLDLEVVAEDGIDNYQLSGWQCFLKTFGMIQASFLEGRNATANKHTTISTTTTNGTNTFSFLTDANLCI